MRQYVHRALGQWWSRHGQFMGFHNVLSKQQANIVHFSSSLLQLNIKNFFNGYASWHINSLVIISICLLFRNFEEQVFTNVGSYDRCVWVPREIQEIASLTGLHRTRVIIEPELSKLYGLLCASLVSRLLHWNCNSCLFLLKLSWI